MRDAKSVARARFAFLRLEVYGKISTYGLRTARE